MRRNKEGRLEHIGRWFLLMGPGKKGDKFYKVGWYAHYPNPEWRCGIYLGWWEIWIVIYGLHWKTRKKEEWELDEEVNDRW